MSEGERNTSNKRTEMLSKIATHAGNMALKSTVMVGKGVRETGKFIGRGAEKAGMKVVETVRTMSPEDRVAAGAIFTDGVITYRAYRNQGTSHADAAVHTAARAINNTAEYRRNKQAA